MIGVFHDDLNGELSYGWVEPRAIPTPHIYMAGVDDRSFAHSPSHALRWAFWSSVASGSGSIRKESPFRHRP